MNIRRNIYNLTPQELADFQDALNAIKADGSYDEFIERHHHAMMEATPLSGETVNPGVRNVAHRGPAFLPWHRYFCRELELLLQAKKKNVTLPYWDEAGDAVAPAAAALWNTDPSAGPVYVGGDGDGPNGEVTTGPFKHWMALIEDLETGGLVPRQGILRALGSTGGPAARNKPLFPTAAQVENMLVNWGVYDTAPWSPASQGSFRNRLEGWERIVPPEGVPAAELGSQMHNRVHIWVGGDMGPGTSPNDPVFFLHHCNADRLWARWQHTHPTAPYLPASGGPIGHNLGDTMGHLVTTDATPARSLDYRRTLGFIYDTDPPLVEQVSPTVHFQDVPTLETVWRPAVFRIRAGAPVHLEVVSGSGPAAPYGLSSRGGRVTHTPVADNAPFDLVRVWLAFTGAATPGAATAGAVKIRCVETGEVFDFILTGNTVQRETTGVVFALDKSLSMAQPTSNGLSHMQMVREAVTRGAELIRDDSGAGVVTFDQEAHPEVKLSPFAPALSQRADVLAAVNAVEPGGDTSLGDGLVAAQQTMNANGRAFTSRALVVVTDGLENQPKFLDEVGGTITTRTFAVVAGAANLVSAPALTRLANGTGGRLLLTDTPGTDAEGFFRLSTYIQHVLASAADEDVVAEASGVVTPEEEVRVPFQLNETDIEATVILSLDVPSVSLELETPAGRVLTESELTALGATVRRTTNMIFCRFRLPFPAGVGAHSGTWQVGLKADERVLREETAKLRTAAEGDPARGAELDRLTAHGPRYSIVVTAWSNLRLNSRVTQPSMEPGATIRFDAVLAEFGRPVEGRADVEAEVRRPDGVVVTVPLDEEVPGAFRGDLTATMAGVWQARITARGHTFGRTRFARQQRLGIAVLVGGDHPPAPVVGTDVDGND
ncbi:MULTISPECIES: tyrosinase family protein [unclassified Streptomyces]|uniref:tyrosinase family protein n=1 Tax=unclassified Streptomyces TaxID=2593676 RepID=UPI00225BF8C6|nr:tyrosinase family protein [Streptomyces sp. NBC_00047]MCX5613325.1 tyrosinase family protein [Streptomyces sp. NBC_00047]